MGPKNVELTAEIAEGWQPIFFYPEKAQSVWGEALDAGRARRDPTLGPLDVMSRRCANYCPADPSLPRLGQFVGGDLTRR